MRDKVARAAINALKSQIDGGNFNWEPGEHYYAQMGMITNDNKRLRELEQNVLLLLQHFGLRVCVDPPRLYLAPTEGAPKEGGGT